MTVDARETDRSAIELMESALGGDEAAFTALTEPHRRALHVHCYRMLGSLHEAEDVVQETMLRAWRRLDTYRARAPFRAWLYGIATNACLDALAKRRPRILPRDIADPDDPSAPPAPPLTDVAWLEPYPDRLRDETEPETRLERRESIRLAFVAAIQHLAPRQRAVLLLRDVLGWSAKEVAELLGSSVASVNSALHRARTAVDALPPVEPTPDAATAELVARYVAAWDAADVAALASLLKEDVEMAMPPTPSWYRGRDAVVDFFAAHFQRFPLGRLTLALVGANGGPAFAIYDDGSPFAIKVLELDGGRVQAITGFVDPTLFGFFNAGGS